MRFKNNICLIIKVVKLHLPALIGNGKYKKKALQMENEAILPFTFGMFFYTMPEQPERN